MPRAQPDFVDILCMSWASQRRKALGIILPSKLEPRERLGKLRCTLAAVREDGEGASYSTLSQNWPEVYTGDALIVHRCWCGMQRPWAELMHMHYVWKELPFMVKVEYLELDVNVYYERLRAIKQHVDLYMKGMENPPKPKRIQGVRLFWAVGMIS